MIYGFIFARAGSKGLPNKNILPFMGKPLIAWSIEQARNVAEIDRLIVSTDSHEIAAVAQSFGAEVPFLRPKSLAGDDSPEWKSWEHALNFLLKEERMLPECMVSIPTTAPLRLPSDISSCIREFRKGQSDVVIAVTPPHRNPYFNMIRIDESGSAKVAIESDVRYFRRQDAPEVFDMTTTCFVADPHFVLSGKTIFEGRVGTVLVPHERSIDIDTIHDFKLAEYLFQQNQEKG